MTRGVPVAAALTAAALLAGGCGTSSSSSPTADLFRIPNMTNQDLMRQLQQPTNRGPGGFEMLAGPQHLSLRGIQFTTQGVHALRTWLNTPAPKQAAYKQAGQNLAIAFPADKAEIDRRLR